MNSIKKEIPVENLGTLKEKIVSLNKRAAKLKVAPLQLIEHGRRDEDFFPDPKNNPTFKIVRTFVEVEIVGESPVVSGWSLAAVVEVSVSGERMLKTVPGVGEIPESFRSGSFYCEHCQTDRYRKEVFVLRSEAGEFKQVGRNCLKDFLGHHSPEQMLSYAEFLFSVAEELDESELDGYGGSGGRVLTFSPINWLAWTAVIIRKIGWVSAAVSNSWDGKASTRSIVLEILGPKFNKEQANAVAEFIAKYELDPNDKDTELAMKALEWAKAMPTAGVGDYLYNIGVVARGDYLTYKELGLATSIIPAYLKHVEKEEVNRQEFAKRSLKPLVHVGTVGKREQFNNLRVMKIQAFDGAFGVTSLIKFRDEDGTGNHILWWASGNSPKWLEDAHQDKTLVNIVATVKKHEEYKDTPQTVVSRVSEPPVPKEKKPRKKKSEVVVDAVAVGQLPVGSPNEAPF